jgi:hypothetical protein
MLSLSIFGLKLTLQTLLQEEVVFTIVRDGSGFVNLTLESLHGII